MVEDVSDVVVRVSRRLPRPHQGYSNQAGNEEEAEARRHCEK